MLLKCEYCFDSYTVYSCIVLTELQLTREGAYHSVSALVCTPLEGTHCPVVA